MDTGYVAHDIVREAGDVGRWTVFDQLLKMVADPVLERRGFVIVGPNELMEPIESVCRSRIEDVRLTVMYTML